MFVILNTSLLESLRYGVFASVYCVSIFRSDTATNPSLAEVLNQHRDQYLHQDKSKTYRITVRRAHIWQDALKCFERKFDAQSNFSRRASS